jgi:hypothetical protein
MYVNRNRIVGLYMDHVNTYPYVDIFAFFADTCRGVLTIEIE